MSGKVTKLSSEVPHLSYDLVFQILLLLPAKILYKFSFVCKTWYKLINSSAFIEAHLCLCETALIFLQRRPSSENRPNTFSIENQLSDNPTQFKLFVPSTSMQLQKEYYIHYLEFFQDGKKAMVRDPNICGLWEILATYNGLILATTSKSKSLLVMNPVTRKLIRLPLGTIVSTIDESYGFVFDQHKYEYKVVHLYRDSQRYIGCEVLSLRRRVWRAIDGPTSDKFRSFKLKAVAANGSLYWLPATQGCSYIVSLSMNNEKFATTPLPINNSSRNDKLIEIGGLLSFVAHVTKYRIQVWSLYEKGVEEIWVKKYTINMATYIADLVPVFATRNGSRLVFKKYNEDFLSAYDFKEEEMKKVEMETEGTLFFPSLTCLPHISSLASWENLQP